MCESKVYSIAKGEKRLLLEGVSKLFVGDSSVICYDILGNPSEIGKCRLKEIDFVKDEVIVELLSE